MGVLPAWSTEGFAQRSGRLGFPTWLKWRVFNSTIIFLPHLALAYSIIYFVLPRQYFNKKSLAKTTILFAGCSANFVCLLSFCELVEWNNQD
jgi:hypothetical protein